MKFFTIISSLLISYKATATPLIITPGDLSSYRIDVDVNFDGQIKRFQLDTGANASMVAPDNQTVTYPSTGKAHLEGASGVAVDCDLIEAAQLSIGDLNLSNFQIKRCDLGKNSFNNLGIGAFKDQILNLDFTSKNLFLLDHVAADWSMQPLTRLSDAHLKIATTIDGKRSNALFDTGAQITSVDSLFVESNPHLFKLLLSEEAGTDITGKPVFMKFYELSEMKIGEVVLKNITVAAFDFNKLRSYFGEDTPVILGTNAMIQANWIIDLRTNQWGIKKI